MKIIPKKSVKFQFDVSKYSFPNECLKGSKYLPEVQDICTATGIFEQRDICLDLLVSSNKLFQNINCRERSSATQFEKVVSLFELIHLHNSKIHKLSLAKRRSLAARIAASLLLLHTSPWIGDSLWTSKDIFVGIGREGFVSSPYVSKPFTDEQLSTQPGDASANSSSETHGSLHNNPVVFVVGIVLLELGLGKPFETLADSSNCSNIATATEGELLTIALQSLRSKRCREKLSVDYRQATELCITQVFRANCKQFSDSEFREEYCREVVEPILREYRTFSGKV